MMRTIRRVASALQRMGRWGINDAPDALARATAKALRLVIAMVVVVSALGSGYVVWQLGRWAASLPPPTYPVFPGEGLPGWFWIVAHWVMIIILSLMAAARAQAHLSQLCAWAYRDEADNNRGGERHGPA